MSVTLSGINRPGSASGTTSIFTHAPRSDELSSMTGQQVFLKLDNLQHHRGLQGARSPQQNPLPLFTEEEKSAVITTTPETTPRPSPTTPPRAACAPASSCP